VGIVKKHSNMLTVHYLGCQDYQTVFQEMQQFTAQRTEDSIDEIWFLEHPSVFTLGRNGKPEHILDAGDIPVIQIDRGGQVTYHAQGQLIVYLLLDIRRANIGVRQLVTLMENSIINFLAEQLIIAQSQANAPGVYVKQKKIAALGLRISQGRSYHGLSLNINMDLSPFQRINPCGYQGLEITQCADLGFSTSVNAAGKPLLKDYLIPVLGYWADRVLWY
jgi:lipoyl(octanoyl) transferase